jgi:hypothetical protein
VAIVQISRITQRKGQLDDLPQLGGAEFGYAVNERRLFIGNGTLQEGAPVIGNTEILTEFSNIFELQNTYTYKGEAAGYVAQTGPAAGSPITQSLQARLDSFVVVTDFGAVGDGITDNTDAINRAMFELYCRSNNVAARRGLYFPAGVYLISESIIIPPFAYLYGDGPTASVIMMDQSSDVSSLNSYVARTGDSLQQTGAQIGNNGATPPMEISIQNMGFQSIQEIDLFLVDTAHDTTFINCGFAGPLTVTQIATGAEGNISGIVFNSTGSLIVNNISLQQCLFTNTTYASHVTDVVQGIAFTDCHFDTLFEGIYVDQVLGGTPEGIRIVSSTFDNIFQRGVVFENSYRCVSAFNTFYDVGNRFSATPTDPVIYINEATNTSINDMFARTDTQVQTTLIPRIQTLDNPVVNLENGRYVNIGNYQIGAAQVTAIADNASTTTLFTTDSGNPAGSPMTGQFHAFDMRYTFVRGTIYRSGTLSVIAGSGSGGYFYTDDYTENATSGLTLTVSQSTNTITVSYATTSTGQSGEITYSLQHLA